MAGRGINKVILVGNLGKDPEVRYTPSGDAVCNITVATSEAWKDKASGEQKDSTEWHRVVAFGRLAEIMSEFLIKGSKVYIEGKLKTRKWQDKDGSDRYTTEIVAADMLMLSGKSEESPRQDGVRPSAKREFRKPAEPPRHVPDFEDDHIPSSDFEDDDIPF